MRWIVQNGFKVDKAYGEFLENLERMKIDVTYIKTIPFSDETDPPLTDNLTNVICFGSIGLGKIAKKKNWTPGIFFNEDFNMMHTTFAYGRDMFNYSARFGAIKTIVDVPDEFFIRPVLDDKSFSGQVITKEEYLKWRSQIYSMEQTSLGKDSYVQVSPDTVIQISPLQEIAAEYRFMVVDKEVITGSRYRFGNKIIHLPFDQIDADIIQFAKDKAKQYQPDRAFVLDVAINELGEPKVLELGCINACGFYAADTQKLIDAIENMSW